MSETRDKANKNRGSTLSVVIAMLIAIPLAAATGAFAGWCLGTSAGQWLEFLGIPQAFGLGGTIGAVSGAITCSGYLAYGLFQADDRPKQQQERGIGENSP